MIGNRPYITGVLHAAFLLGLCGVILWAIFLKTGQLEYPYPLDDSYIHLSISTSLVENGAWAPDPSRFDFSTSSPLFTLILGACFLITGPSVWWPMVLGICGGLILLLSLYSYLHSQHITQRNAWVWIIVILTPFPLLMLMGMEHMLQLLFCFLWVKKWLSNVEGQEKTGWQFIVLTILLVTIRYEGLFLVAAASLWWVVQGRWKNAMMISFVGGATVAIIGVISISAGSTFLPLSLLMKGHHPELNLYSVLEFVQQTLEKLYSHPFIFFILSISAIGVWMGKSLPIRLRAFSALLQATSWIHVLLAEIGGYRYEAYLVFLHLILLAELLHNKGLRLSLHMFLAGIWLLIPLLIRSAFFTLNYPLAVQNIYHQSVQVGKFIQTYYPSTPIAIQDIGVATWLSDFPVTDLAGIGDGEINELFRNKTISPESIRPILEGRGVELAIIQQGWMGWVIPQEWKAAGSWTIQNHLIIALPEVFFWAATEEAYQKLQKNLREFSVQLPESVIQEGPYVGSPMPRVEKAP